LTIELSAQKNEDGIPLLRSLFKVKKKLKSMVKAKRPRHSIAHSVSGQDKSAMKPMRGGLGLNYGGKQMRREGKTEIREGGNMP